MRLQVAGKPFRFGGANIEWLGVAGYGPADPAGPHYPSHYEVDDALATAQELGATVVRSQTMGDSVGCAACIEPELGTFNDARSRRSTMRSPRRAHTGIKIIPDHRRRRRARGRHTAASISAGAASRIPNCSLVNMEPFWTDATVIGDVEAAHRRGAEPRQRLHARRLQGRSRQSSAGTSSTAAAARRAWTRQIVAVHPRDRHAATSSSPARERRIPGVDACVAFIYPHWFQPLAVVQPRIAACRRARKPFLAYEYGWDRTNYPTLAALRRSSTRSRATPEIAGDAFWALQAHSDGHGWMPIPADTTDPTPRSTRRERPVVGAVLPGHPTLVNTRADMARPRAADPAHNYAMRGLAVPPHMSRRARAGSRARRRRASTGRARPALDVQRAARRRRSGPWHDRLPRAASTTAATASTRRGRTGWYRVIPSNLDRRPSRPSPAAHAEGRTYSAAAVLSSGWHCSPRWRSSVHRRAARTWTSRRRSADPRSSSSRSRSGIASASSRRATSSALSNKNGSLLSLLSRPDHARLLAGQNGCLWVARADGVTDYVGGCA